MPLEEQNLLTFPDHPHSPSSFSWVHIAQYLVFCVVFRRPFFVFFPLSINVSVLRALASDCSFVVCKSFVLTYIAHNVNLFSTYSDHIVQRYNSYSTHTGHVQAIIFINLTVQNYYFYSTCTNFKPSNTLGN